MLPCGGDSTAEPTDLEAATEAMSASGYFPMTSCANVRMSNAGAFMVHKRIRPTTGTTEHRLLVQ